MQQTRAVVRRNNNTGQRRGRSSGPPVSPRARVRGRSTAANRPQQDNNNNSDQQPGATPLSVDELLKKHGLFHLKDMAKGHRIQLIHQDASKKTQALATFDMSMLDVMVSLLRVAEAAAAIPDERNKKAAIRAAQCILPDTWLATIVRLFDGKDADDTISLLTVHDTQHANKINIKKVVKQMMRLAGFAKGANVKRATIGNALLKKLPAEPAARPCPEPAAAAPTARKTNNNNLPKLSSKKAATNSNNNNLQKLDNVENTSEENGEKKQIAPAAAVAKHDGSAASGQKPSEEEKKEEENDEDVAAASKEKPSSMGEKLPSQKKAATAAATNEKGEEQPPHEEAKTTSEKDSSVVGENKKDMTETNDTNVEPELVDETPAPTPNKEGDAAVPKAGLPETEGNEESTAPASVENKAVDKAEATVPPENGSESESQAVDLTAAEVQDSVEKEWNDRIASTKASLKKVVEDIKGPNVELFMTGDGMGGIMKTSSARMSPMDASLFRQAQSNLLLLLYPSLAKINQALNGIDADMVPLVGPEIQALHVLKFQLLSKTGQHKKALEGLKAMVEGSRLDPTLPIVYARALVASVGYDDVPAEMALRNSEIVLRHWQKMFQTSGDTETVQLTKEVKTLLRRIQDLLPSFPGQVPVDEESSENKNLHDCLVGIAAIVGVTAGNSGGARAGVVAKAIQGYAKHGTKTASKARNVIELFGAAMYVAHEQAEAASNGVKCDPSVVAIMDNIGRSVSAPKAVRLEMLKRRHLGPMVSLLPSSIRQLYGRTMGLDLGNRNKGLRAAGVLSVFGAHASNTEHHEEYEFAIVELNSSSHIAMLRNLGNNDFQKGRFNLAKNNYEMALEQARLVSFAGFGLDEFASNRVAARLSLDIASCLSKLGDNDGYIAGLERAIQFDGTHVESLEALARCFEDTDDDILLMAKACRLYFDLLFVVFETKDDTDYDDNGQLTPEEFSNVLVWRCATKLNTLVDKITNYKYRLPQGRSKFELMLGGDKTLTELRRWWLRQGSRMLTVDKKWSLLHRFGDAARQLGSINGIVNSALADL